MVSENTQHYNGGSINGLEFAHSGQELDEDHCRQRRQKKLRMWGLGLVSIVVVAMIIAGVILGRSGERTAWNQPEYIYNEGDITLDDIFSHVFYPKLFNGSWISGNEIQYREEDGGVTIFNVPTMAKRNIISGRDPILVGTNDVSLSADKQFILFEKNPRKLYRYSYLATYFIRNLLTGHTQPLKHEGKTVEMQLVEWAPEGHSLVYVHNNNIYYLSKPENNFDSIALTKDGIFGEMYNGVPDWVYEEEVFGSNKALWFSPNGKQLAFASFNDTETHTIPIPYYGQPGDLAFQYPLEQRIRYPKAGTTNPQIKLSVIDLEKLTAKELPIPEAMKRDPILATVAWATDEDIMVLWLNRNQDTGIYTAYHSKTAGSIIVTTLHETNGWLDTFVAPTFSKDGTHFITIKSHPQKNNSGDFAHVTMYKREANSQGVPLTSGTYVVTDIVAWDETNGFVYYLATTEDDPAIRHLYQISMKNSSIEPKCITCDKTPMTNSVDDNSKCLYNGAKFSTDKSNFILSCTGPDVPEVVVWKTSTLSPLFIWEDNQELRALVEKKRIPQIRRFKVPVGDKYMAQVKLLLPQDLDESGRTKYPMLVKVYAGPGTYQVTEQYSVEWESYLVANKSIIVAMIDGRGSGLKGDQMMFTGYKNLGTVEIYDQINVTRNIQDQFSYVDEARTAIWGWSYGGYATGMALILDKKNVFKCGMSVAPVTDWALYDSIYTERYMRQPTPEDNRLGYQRAMLLDKVEALREKEYFLIHGTMDDNVHYQQSMMLARVLEKEDIMFRELSYPDEDHGLAGVRRHLYHNLEDFLDNCFDTKAKC